MSASDAPNPLENGIVLRKNTRFPLVNKERYFEVDESRSALTYWKLDADSKKREFCGAVPLELIQRVGRDERGSVLIDIPGRAFVLSASDASMGEELDQWVEELALHASQRQGGVEPPSERDSRWWKDEAAYRARPFCGAAERVGLKSRAAHEGYPERAKVPRDKVEWSTELPGYAPPSAGGGSAEGESASPASWCGVLPRSDDGRVLNPSGRTGLVGRGALPRCGPNQEIRICLTRRGEDGVTQVVVVRRKAGGEWQLPGGMLPAGSDAAARPTYKQFRQAFTLQAAAARTKHSEGALDMIFGPPPKPPAKPPQEAAPEAGEGKPPKAEAEGKPPKAEAEEEKKPSKAEEEKKQTAGGEAEQPEAAGEAQQPRRRRASSTAATVAARAEQPWLVHCGYADATAATDEAWLESAVGHFHASEEAANDLLLQEGAGAVAARWVSVPAPGQEARGYWEDVMPLHRSWVYASLMLGGARRGE